MSHLATLARLGRDNLNARELSKALKRLAGAPDLAAYAACHYCAGSVCATLSVPANVPRQARELRQLVQGLQAALCRGWALLLPLPSSIGNASSSSSSAEAVRPTVDVRVSSVFISLILLLHPSSSSSELAVELCLQPSFLQPLSATAAAAASELLDGFAGEAAAAPDWLRSMGSQVLRLWPSMLDRAAFVRGARPPVPAHALSSADGPVRLALAVLRLGAGVADPQQALAAATWADSVYHAVLILTTTAQLLDQYTQATPSSSQPSCHWSALLPPEVAVAASAASWLMGAAVAAHMAPHSSSSSSSNSSSRPPGGAVLQLPPHAEALRVALGGPSLQLLAAAVRQLAGKAFFAPAAAAGCLLRISCALADESAGGALQLQAPQVRLVCALLCAAAESAVQLLAQPQAQQGVPSQQDRDAALDATDLLHVLSALLVVLGAAAISNDGSPAALAAEAGLAGCQALLLQQLVPALWHEVCRQRARQQALQEGWTEAVAALLSDMTCAVVKCPSLLPLLRTALAAQGGALLPLLEWAVRAGSRQADSTTSKLASGAMVMLRAAMQTDWAGAAPAWLAAGASRPTRRRALFALAVSCLKGAAAELQMLQAVAGVACGLAAQLITQLEEGGAASSSSDPRWQRDWPGLLGSPLAPWLVLAARGLQAEAWCLAQQAQSGQLHAEGVLRLSGACRWLSRALRSLAAQRPPGAASEAEAASLAAHAATLEQLANQAAGVEARLQQLQAALGSAGPAGSSALELAKQAAGEAASLAAGVVGELPLPLCCNNPACSNLAQHSEAALVGTGVCACGGCRMARFCCRACQIAARRRHKRVCKQLAAAQLAAGPALPAIASRRQLPPAAS